MKSTQPESSRKAYTLEETAAFFGKERSWAYRQVKAGRIKVITGYGAMLVPRPEIERILNSAGEIR
jgi:predicted DNA-binding transcriptional regulator AlpA